MGVRPNVEIKIYQPPKQGFAEDQGQQQKNTFGLIKKISGHVMDEGSWVGLLIFVLVC
jgi:hypothetical protein